MADEQAGIKQLRKIKETYVDRVLQWYGSRRCKPRILYRLAGTIVILASLSLPILVAHSANQGAAIAANIAAFLVAAISALHAFYTPHEVWQKYTTTYLTLEGLIVLWDMEMLQAERLATPDEQFAVALEATKKLVAETHSLVNSQTSQFFKNIKFPEMAPKTGSS